jgi:hypothetical protein
MESFLADPHPFKQGNVICLWYNKETHQPRIVIGPDWCFCLLKIALLDGVTLMVIIGGFYQDLLTISLIMLTLLLLENIAYFTTVLMNPGLAPRNISGHEQSYLKGVSSDQYCKLCRIIEREDK